MTDDAPNDAPAAANGQASPQPAGNPSRRRRRPSRQKRRPDLWRTVPELPDPPPIDPADQPSALLRSLGDPPLQGQANSAQGYMLAVVERAAALATALAAAGGLLADDDEA